MSDRRALILFAIAIAAHFLVPVEYAPYIVGAIIFGLFIFLGFKIDDLQSDLKSVQRDVAELQDARKRDLEE